MFSPVLFYSFCSIPFYYILSSPFPCGQPTLPTGVLRLAAYTPYRSFETCYILNICFLPRPLWTHHIHPRLRFRRWDEFIPGFLWIYFFRSGPLRASFCSGLSSDFFPLLRDLSVGPLSVETYFSRIWFELFFFAPVLARFYSGFPSNLFSLVRNACECKVRSWQNIFRILFDFFSPLDRTLWIPTVLVWELYVPNHGSWQ